MEKQSYYISFMSLSLDLIQNEMQNKKLRSESNLHPSRGHCVMDLGVRAYNPSVQQMTREKKASELLIDWCKLILQEYSIDAECHILTSCSDSGSDFKHALEKVLPMHREWCVSHLIHLVLADAFGCSVDPHKFQVHMLLMHANFGVLDEKTELASFDPSLTIGECLTSTQAQINPLDHLEPTGVSPANSLDPGTFHVRKLLRLAMYERYYKQYHPRDASKKTSICTRIKKPLFSYLFDIQAVLHPHCLTASYNIPLLCPLVMHQLKRSRGIISSFTITFGGQYQI